MHNNQNDISADTMEKFHSHPNFPSLQPISQAVAMKLFPSSHHLSSPLFGTLSLGSTLTSSTNFVPCLVPGSLNLFSFFSSYPTIPPFLTISCQHYQTNLSND